MDMVPGIHRSRCHVALPGHVAGRLCLRGALLLSILAPNAGAQQVTGRLVDRETSRPIATGLLTLHAADSSVVMRTMSDTEGRWTVHAPQPGNYFIAVRRLGYRPFVSGAMQIPPSVASSTVFRLDQLPVTLNPVAAQAAAIRRNLELNGFFERQKGNFGHFVSAEAIDRRQASRITDLLTSIPGVQLFVGGGGSAGPLQIGLRGSSVTDGALCRPRVFVDDVMYARGDSKPVRVRASDATEQEDLEARMDRSLSLDDIGHPSTIAAIEVYRSATQVPVQFGGTSAETLCGVIVIWTRTGRTPTDTLQRPR
jgi:hypothetical protein